MPDHIIILEDPYQPSELDSFMHRIIYDAKKDKIVCQYYFECAWHECMNPDHLPEI